MDSSTPDKKSNPTRPPKTPTSKSSGKGKASKEQPSTTPSAKSDSANKSKASPTDVNANDDSAGFEEVDLREESDDPDFTFLHQKDAPHSSYNSQADHKRKYSPGTIDGSSRAAMDAAAPTGDEFEDVKKDKDGTSSRNGAADRAEKYD